MTADLLPVRPRLAWPQVAPAWGGLVARPAVARTPLSIHIALRLAWGAVSPEQGTHPGIERVLGDVVASCSPMVGDARHKWEEREQICPSVDGWRCWPS
jgi:hypothetical protein